MSIAQAFKSKKWIKGAIKNPGALHREMGIPQEKKIPTDKLDQATNQPGLLGKRARLAQSLRGFKKAPVQNMKSKDASWQ